MPTDTVQFPLVSVSSSSPLALVPRKKFRETILPALKRELPSIPTEQLVPAYGQAKLATGNVDEALKAVRAEMLKRLKASKDTDHNGNKMIMAGGWKQVLQIRTSWDVNQTAAVKLLKELGHADKIGYEVKVHDVSKLQELLEDIPELSEALSLTPRVEKSIIEKLSKEGDITEAQLRQVTVIGKQTEALQSPEKLD